MRLFLSPDQYIDTNQPLDISLPLSDTSENPRAWYVDAPKFEPVRANGYIGSIKEGGSVNFRNIFFNPHGHGTHTECLGHITPIIYSVNQCLKTYFFKAEVITIIPEVVVTDKGEIDLVIQKNQLLEKLNSKSTEALIIRTLPNDYEKTKKDYSATNPPYIDIQCIEILNNAGIKHLLIDTPSVDRESDGGELVFHHAFWNVPEDPQFDKTITELIYVNDQIEDGSYILNLQTAPFENDATPSRPVLYEIMKA